jgi:hypothetical protein
MGEYGRVGQPAGAPWPDCAVVNGDFRRHVGNPHFVSIPIP